MTKLYEATDDYRDIQRHADEEAEANEGVITNETFNELMEASATVQECLLRSARMIANWKGELPGLEAEIKRLKARKKATDNKINGYKDYVLRELMTLPPGERTVSDDVFKISAQKNPMSVEVLDEDIVDLTVTDKGTTWIIATETIEIKVDKDAVKKYYKATKIVPDGCRIIEDRHSLRIR